MNISQLINREVADSLYFQTNILQLINREVADSLYIQMNISQLSRSRLFLIFSDEHFAVN